jgi:DNA-binding transcriptional regulator YiaG
MKGGNVKGYHTRWDIPDEHRESAEYIEAGAHIALGQAVYDRRTALGLSQAEFASRASTTQTVIHDWRAARSPRHCHYYTGWPVPWKAN